MPSSEARIAANRANALKSTGPKTPEGKERSRANALKHGLTGAGVVLPEADAAEVERRAAAFVAETDAIGEVGHALARRAALNSVRMERGADQQSAALAEHVRRVEADFEAPEGVDAAEADRLRHEAARRAMFDPSPEAHRARQYEAAAERGFFRALKELQAMARRRAAEVRLDQAARVHDEVASFFDAQQAARAEDAWFDALDPEMADLVPSRRAPFPILPPKGGVAGLNFSIGRPG